MKDLIFYIMGICFILEISILFGYILIKFADWNGWKDGSY